MKESASSISTEIKEVIEELRPDNLMKELSGDFKSSMHDILKELNPIGIFRDIFKPESPKKLLKDLWSKK